LKFTPYTHNRTLATALILTEKGGMLTKAHITLQDPRTRTHGTDQKTLVMKGGVQRLRNIRKLGFMASVGLLLLTLVFFSAQAVNAQSSSSTNSYYQQFVNKVAQILGKKPQEVQSAMTQASEDVIDQAVKDGKITQQQAQEIKSRIQETGMPFPFFGRHMHGPCFPAVAGTVSKISGNTVTVKTDSGSKTVQVSADTVFRKDGQEATKSDLKVGEFVRVIGQENSQGVIEARAVLIGEGEFGWHHRGWDRDEVESTNGASSNSQ